MAARGGSRELAVRGVAELLSTSSAMSGEPKLREEAPSRTPDSVFSALEISSPRRVLLFSLCLAIALAASWVAGADSGLSPAGRRALFILVFAAGLWVTEAIPPFATGILVIGLKILLLGNPAAGVSATRDTEWEEFVVVIGHPLVWLFFGGFVMAAGMARTGLDRQLAAIVLGRLGGRPPAVLLGVMGITFTLSMFISNTATTAMTLSLLAPLLASLPSGDRYARGLLLGVAAAANLGGMGSLIGSPPNAIAVGALASLDPPVDVSFLDWMLLGLPPAVVLLVATWAAISRLYSFEGERLPTDPWRAESESDEPRAPRWQRLVTAATLLFTVGLWLSTEWHGIPATAISFVPIVMFTLTGVVGSVQLRTLSWDVLFLLAGGLALGETLTQTGLSSWIVNSVAPAELGLVGLAFLLSYVTLVLSNVMSNTAAANIMVPLGATLAAGHGTTLSIPIALAASLAMCLPISTPPNALVFSSGRCETRDFIRLGVAVGLAGPAVAIAWIALVFRTLSGG